MGALTADQIELLQRARDGLPMWGGSVATHRLRREVDLLLVMQLITSSGSCPYRLTATGALALDATRNQSSSWAKMPPKGSRAGST